MQRRRQFLKTFLGFLTGIAIWLSPVTKAFRLAYGKPEKKILPKDFNRADLMDEDPAELDTRHLEITPLEDFETMGEVDHEVDLNQWRLEVSGRIEKTLSLTNKEIQALPSIERNVLLICPGVFANHGQWKGISLGKLIEKAKLKKGATQVAVSGPKIGSYQKVEGFPLEDVLSDKVFLSYGVNGHILPMKHGFPLRIVAEGYYGSNWVKYVYKVKVR